MADRFTNEQDWMNATLALVVWAAHFSLLWAASVVFPGQPAARWLALAFTVAAAAALAWLWRRAQAKSLFSVPGLGIGIAGAGVAFDAIPALIG